MIPPGHPVLDPRLLEAEATGLLDRMLGVLQDNSRYSRSPVPVPCRDGLLTYSCHNSDAILVDATLNLLSILIRTRPGTSNRITNVVLGFNPLKLANSPMTPKNKVMMKSMEKTTRILLLHLLKRCAYLSISQPSSGRTNRPRDPNNQLAGRIQQHIDKLLRSRSEIFDEANRKRAYAEQPQANNGEVKRQKLEGPVLPLQIPPLAPGPQSLAAVYTLTNNIGLQGFDATQVPAGLAARINVKTLAGLDQQILDQAVNVSAGDVEYRGPSSNMRLGNPWPIECTLCSCSSGSACRDQPGDGATRR